MGSLLRENDEGPIGFVLVGPGGEWEGTFLTLRLARSIFGRLSACVQECPKDQYGDSCIPLLLPTIGECLITLAGGRMAFVCTTLI